MMLGMKRNRIGLCNTTTYTKQLHQIPLRVLLLSAAAALV